MADPKPITYMAAVDRLELALDALRSGRPLPPPAIDALGDLLAFFAKRWIPPAEVKHYPLRAELQDLVMRLANTLPDQEVGDRG